MDCKYHFGQHLSDGQYSILQIRVNGMAASATSGSPSFVDHCPGVALLCELLCNGSDRGAFILDVHHVGVRSMLLLL